MDALTHWRSRALRDARRPPTDTFQGVEGHIPADDRYPSGNAAAQQIFNTATLSLSCAPAGFNDDGNFAERSGRRCVAANNDPAANKPAASSIGEYSHKIFAVEKMFIERAVGVAAAALASLRLDFPSAPAFSPAPYDPPKRRRAPGCRPSDVVSVRSNEPCDSLN